MDDWLDSYKHIKEFAGLCEDTMNLRNYYNSHKYTKMMDHIRLLMLKYPVEAGTWNAVNTVRIPASDYEQHFRTAESFLKEVAEGKLTLYVLEAGVGLNQMIFR